MAALTFFAYFSLGLGPGLVFFCLIIAPKSFLVLLTLFSAFYWLFILLVTSSIVRGFVPLATAVGPYAGLLVASVVIQEIGRLGVWYMHRVTVTHLRVKAREEGHRFWLVDQLYMALAWGFGHAACHSFFFFVSLLPLTGGSATFYNTTCPDMSLFLVGALYSLAWGMLLTSLMVVALDGWEGRDWTKRAYPPVMHMAAALATLGNLRTGACTYVMPLLLVAGAANVAVALRVAWAKGVRQ